MRRLELFGAALLFAATLASVPAVRAEAAPACGGALSDWQNATYSGFLVGENGRMHSVTVRIPGETATVTTDTHSWEAQDAAVELRGGTLTWGRSVPDLSFTHTLQTPMCVNGSKVLAAQFIAERGTIAGSTTASGWVVRTADRPMRTAQ
ncbi:hypothetical protein NDR87_32595 [Nocardia sp. CDC159]|uniref:Uncharacterized protein n=1 Tax=Nocardia pulmonis TaxID=2951408 RepID=A0A9X2EG51_9NOCA|nr:MULTISPECIES: hypothetical protein [Nocardia]MCM6778233.1 hypothetical protein [Nocardia pulmonis]MCM6791122.1 hypothetical protein [Nocardia sp. CDC159]